VANVLILGAGVMGSALAVPAADCGHAVRLVGTPFDRKIIATLKRRGGMHPKLDAPLPDSVEPLDVDELTQRHFVEAQWIIIGVSSPGIAWVTARLGEMLSAPRPVAFVTKGLDASAAGVRTFAESVPAALPSVARDLFIGIGGPCIARELANRWPTASVYACSDRARAEEFSRLMQTGYYRLDASDDVTGVEACAALKNFYAIGVSAMQTRHPDTARAGAQAKNPTAAAFNQAVREMARICRQIGGRRETAFNLAGLGDLHVTVGGGRNSRLGQCLGTGRRVSEIMGTELVGETVEGIDTARALSAWIEGGLEGARLKADELPLALAIVKAVVDDSPFEFDFGLMGRA
jgi:glycerol-3-phosphate dehydrogenase (NAD(P)+)